MKRKKTEKNWYIAYAGKFVAIAVAAGVLAGCSGQAAGDSTADWKQSENQINEEEGQDENTKDRQQKQSDAGRKDGNTREIPIIEDKKITMGEIEVSLEPEDEYNSWDENTAVKIELQDSQIAIKGQGAKAEGSTVTITEGGTYVLEGTLSNGSVLVDAKEDSQVRLVLKGADIHSESSAAIDIKKAAKTIISLEEGTINSLSDSQGLIYRSEEKEEPNGALFCKGDLTINGSGTLKVDGAFNNAVSCKDILKITGGTIEVTAVNHGIKGNDALVIYDGQLRITATGDGVKSDILAAVLGGDTQILDCEEGLEAENVVIQGGKIELIARDDGINASTDGTNTPQIYFMGGDVTLRAEGDGIDSNGSVFMSGGQVTVYGPSRRDNGALDYDREFKLTGGVLAAFGPGGMDQNVSSADSQVSVLADFGQSLKAGTEVTLRDSQGNELYKGRGEKDFRTVVISVPEMAVGGRYEIAAGENVISFVAEQTVTYVNEEGIQKEAAMGFGRGGPRRQGGPGSRAGAGEEWKPEERPKLPEGGEGGRRLELPEERERLEAQGNPNRQLPEERKGGE